MPHLVKLVIEIICDGGGPDACDDNEGGQGGNQPPIRAHVRRYL
jgi:hypothetical protein